jgi:HPt (histidine-containing phosphotransfer) domain-containing protein
MPDLGFPEMVVAREGLSRAVSATSRSAVLDTDKLRELVGDDDETVREFVRDYAQSAKPMVAQLSHALAERDAATAAFVAHKLKSASRSVGAMEMAQVCEHIEHGGTNLNAAQALPLLQAAWRDLEVALDQPLQSAMRP